MGQLYRFVCDTCDYQTEASGGPDAGMQVVVQTMSCALPPCSGRFAAPVLRATRCWP